jgi:hypothetical protein
MRAGVLPKRVINWDPVTQKEVKEATEDHDALLGYKGDQFLETGTVYAPYIPLITTAGNASVNQRGYVIERPGEGIDRYIYDPNRDGDINALQDIEEKGLVILDDNEEEHYIDAIDPKTLVDNIKRGGPLELKATWTAELDQDLKAYHSIECEKELVKAIEQYVKTKRV